MEIRDLINSDGNLADFSDKDLYHLCQEYGRGIKVLRRVFAVLLVEVSRRNLHRKYGFQSIHEFAAKVGGMNRALVDQILSLARSLRDKPFLWREFRRAGWSKLRVVAGIATVATDEFWAEKVRLLPKPALEVYVKEWKKVNEFGVGRGECDQGLFDGQVDRKREQIAGTDRVYTADRANVGLSSGFGPVEQNLFVERINQKIGEVIVRGIDIFPENGGENRDILLLEPKNLLVQNLGEKVCEENGSVNMGALRVQNFGEKSGGDSWRFEFGNAAFVKLRFNVSRETEFKFLLFKQRLSKKKKMAVTSGEALGILLDIAQVSEK